MTELIDLATLASLGQHFSTLEDSADMRADMLKLQRELNVIKSFLGKCFGSQFSSLFNNQAQQEEGQQEQQAEPVESVRKLVIRAPPKPQQRESSKPPPLQRMNMSANGNQTSSKAYSSLSVMGGGGSRIPAEEEKVERFHRNFLSIRSLKSGSSPSPKNGGSVATTISKIGNGNLSISKIAAVKKETATNGRNSVSGSVTMGSGSYQNGGSAGRRQQVKYEAQYANGDDEENYNEVDETGGMEDYDYYNNSAQQNDEENGDYENLGVDSMAQVEYQEEEYDESYGTNEMDSLDMNGSTYFQHLPPSSVITTTGPRTQPTVSKKAVERRISHPATSTSPTNDGSNDGDGFHKKCKVCHEEVPSFSLVSHVINTHYKGEVPTCRICQKTFTYRQGLISHMRYHDAGKYDKACSYCGKRFIRRSDVIIHERRLHTGERPYQCPVPQCNQGFVRRYCLLTHVKTNHGEPYMSQIMAQSANRRKSS